MPGADFDIYQTEDGYVAVTNEVRRTILAALARKERQLPELVKLTKKAKPTLSSVHMRELLSAKLVEEAPHPSDKRKKIYRLKARRIGSSNLPVEQLRNAVKQYASAATPARLSLAPALDAIAAAPAATPDAALRAQARRLGEIHASQLAAGTPREAVTALADVLEREGVARALRLDLEVAALDLELEKGLAEGAPHARVALLVAALSEGLLEGRVRLAAAKGRRFTLAIG